MDDLARRDAMKMGALAPLLLLLKGSPDMAGSSWTDQLVSLIILAAQASGFSGFFAYNPAPGTGNLILSNAAVAGTDPNGNHYLAGLSSYDNVAGTASSVTAGGIVFYTGSLATGWSFVAEAVYHPAASELFFTAGQMEFNASLATFDGALTVLGNFHVGGGTMPQGAVAGFPVSGSATLATVITALNNLHTAGVNAGVWG